MADLVVEVPADFPGKQIQHSLSSTVWNRNLKIKNKMFQGSHLLKPFVIEGDLRAAKNSQGTEPMVLECFVLAQRPWGSQMDVRQKVFEGT